MTDFRKFIEKCEFDIRAGKAVEVAKNMSTINLSRIPRPHRLPLANICRRVGLSTMGLKILSPIARPQSRVAGGHASDAELSEYGVLLQRSGAIGEALSTLSLLNYDQAPEALLYRSWCLFNIWEYETAIPDLEKYLKYPLSAYMRLVGQVNLAAAYVATECFGKAESLIFQNIEMARANGFSRLLANSYELSAQCQLHFGRLSKARGDLEESQWAIGQSGSYDQLYVKKWQAILECRESSSDTALITFRQEALASEGVGKRTGVRSLPFE